MLSQAQKKSEESATAALNNYITLRLRWADWSEYSRFITWPDEPGWDCWWVAKGYSIAPPRETAAKTIIPVTYKRIGLYCADLQFEPHYKLDKILYQLVRRGRAWKVNGPIPDYPYVGLPTVTASLKQTITGAHETAERKQQAENALKVLTTTAADGADSAVAPSVQARGSASPGSQDVVRTFLSAPNAKSLDTLQHSYCAVLITSSNANLDRLNELVKSGNRWAAKYSARNLKSLGGGNLEDALVALGQFSDRDMVGLLMFAKEGLLSAHELTDALTMLPLTLSDNPDAQLNLVMTRRNKAAAVREQALSDQRAHALKALEDFAVEIRSKQNTP